MTSRQSRMWKMRQCEKKGVASLCPDVDNAGVKKWLHIPFRVLGPGQPVNIMPCAASSSHPAGWGHRHGGLR